MSASGGAAHATSGDPLRGLQPRRSGRPRAHALSDVRKPELGRSRARGASRGRRRCSRHDHERGLDRTGHAETGPPRMAGLAALSHRNPREQLGDVSGHRGTRLAPTPARPCAVRIAAFRRPVIGRRAGCRARPGRPARLARAGTMPPPHEGRLSCASRVAPCGWRDPRENAAARVPFRIPPPPGTLSHLGHPHRGLDRDARRRCQPDERRRGPAWPARRRRIGRWSRRARDRLVSVRRGDPSLDGGVVRLRVEEAKLRLRRAALR
jgi:hypothetical protein